MKQNETTQSFDVIIIGGGAIRRRNWPEIALAGV